MVNIAEPIQFLDRSKLVERINRDHQDEIISNEVHARLTGLLHPSVWATEIQVDDIVVDEEILRALARIRTELASSTDAVSQVACKYFIALMKNFNSSHDSEEALGDEEFEKFMSPVPETTPPSA